MLVANDISHWGVTNIIHIDTIGPEAGNNWYYSFWGPKAVANGICTDTSGPEVGIK